MANSPTKIYFLRRDRELGEWEHVSKSAWVDAERDAGFENTTGSPLEPATAGFSMTKDGRHIEGRCLDVTYYKQGHYDWDPTYRDAIAPVVEAAKTWFDPKWAEQAKADFLTEARKELELDNE